MAADDRALVRKAQAGDQRAFQTLVERYQRKAYSVAYGMMRNPEAAMDVTQDAFIKVHRYLGRFEGTSSFYTWLYRIVVNVSIDHLRKLGKAKTVDYDDTRSRDEDGPSEWSPSTWEMDPAKSLKRREIREKVSQALETLSPNHRAVILMRELQGMSYAEMAEAMECSKGTIMSRLFHARKRMQAALSESLERELPAAAAAS